MTEHNLQPHEVPTLMGDASDLPDLIDAFLHRVYTPAAPTTTGLEPTVIMRLEEHQTLPPDGEPLPSATVLISADAAPAVATVHPEPVEGPATASAPPVPVEAPAPALPPRRITVPVDTRAVSSVASLAERVALEQTLRRGKWRAGLALSGAAAVLAALAVLAFGFLQPEPEEAFVRPPRLPKETVVQQTAPAPDAELAPLTVARPRQHKAARAPAPKTAPKEKASDLKRPNMDPEACAPREPTLVADSNARLFDER